MLNDEQPEIQAVESNETRLQGVIDRLEAENKSLRDGITSISNTVVTVNELVDVSSDEESALRDGMLLVQKKLEKLVLV